MSDCLQVPLHLSAYIDVRTTPTGHLPLSDGAESSNQEEPQRVTGCPAHLSFPLGVQACSVFNTSDPLLEDVGQKCVTIVVRTAKGRRELVPCRPSPRGGNQEVSERDPEGVDGITGKQGPLRA